MSVLLSYGFRPFFALAGIWAVVPMAVLLASLNGLPWPADAVPLFRWHGHEMIFGFAGAAIAGFLLTAVPNWTNRRPIAGAGLALLVAVWILGRIAASPLDLPPWIAVSMGAAFFPALALTLAVPLIASRNTRNWPFLILLIVLFVAQLAFHSRHHGVGALLPFDGLRLAINVVLLMIVIVGGRIVPAFTQNALRRAGRDAHAAAPGWLGAAAVAAAASIVVVDLIVPGTRFAGAIAAIAAVLVVARLACWQGHRMLTTPLVWVLHLGYLWVAVGLALKAVWLLAGSPWAADWMHALTAGAFGTMIMGVTTRATLGHTGRALEASRAIAVAYGLVSVAALIRIFGRYTVPAHALTVVEVAAAVWIAAFGIYLWLYGPVLCAPRADRKPG